MERPTAGFDGGFAQLSTTQLADLERRLLSGLPWKFAVTLAHNLAVEDYVFADWIEVDVSRLREGAEPDGCMDPSQSFMVLFIGRLVWRVAADLDSRSGTPPGGWLGQWLQSANEGLQGRMPSEFLCTPSRRQVLVELLENDCRASPVQHQAQLPPRGEEGAGGRLMEVDADSPHIALTRVPADFPRGAEGAVPGAQSKLVCRRIEGRYVVGQTDDEVAERHGACCALAATLVEYAEHKQKELPGLARSALLVKIRSRLVAKGFDYSPAELDWVMVKVGEGLEVTL